PYPIAPTPLQHQSLAPHPHPPTGPPAALWNIGPVVTGPMFHRAQRNLVKPADTDPGHSISVCHIGVVIRCALPVSVGYGRLYTSIWKESRACASRSGMSVIWSVLGTG